MQEYKREFVQAVAALQEQAKARGDLHDNTTTEARIHKALEDAEKRLDTSSDALSGDELARALGRTIYYFILCKPH